MSPASRSPLDQTDRLIIDGTNLLYRLRAVRADGPGTPAPALVGRIRAAVPSSVAIDLVFDGAGHGVSGRLAQNMLVRYSGRRPADDTILDLVSEVAMQGTGPAAAARVLVVTDDRALRDRLAARGARTARLEWLTSRLDLPVGAGTGGRDGGRRVGIGGPRSPARPAGDEGTPGVSADDDRPAWKPGRGATAKTGPARRVARHKRHPRRAG